MSKVIGARAVSLTRGAVRHIATNFDARILSATECEAVVRDASAMESMAATIKALAAARIAETSAHRATSAASPETHLANLTGMTPSQARASIETGKRLEQLPATSAKARSGGLSTQQTAAITDAAAANPAAERELLASVESSTVGQLRDRCARAKAAADPDPDATHRRLKQGRSGYRYTSADGFSHLDLKSTPEDLAEIDATLTPIVDEIFKAARRVGTRERRDAYVVDAMVEMARRARGASAPNRTTPPTYTMVIRADLAALVNGHVSDGEVCEIAGLGPIPVSLARARLGDSSLKLVLTKGVEVRNVTSLGRGPTAAMKVAMLWEQPECCAEHCGRRARLEADHEHGNEYAETLHTRLDELDNLCDQHHDLKTYQGWALVQGTGIRPMVPRDDSRHPGNLQRERPPP
jgi:hypothetical protein